MAQNMKICQPNDYDQVISYTHFVTFAKYNSVCRIKVYLKYNEEKDVMEIYKIDVKWSC